MMTEPTPEEEVGMTGLTELRTGDISSIYEEKKADGRRKYKERVKSESE